MALASIDTFSVGFLLAPAVLGELGLTVWLLLRGVRPPAQARARTAATAASPSASEVTMLGPRRR
jgi:hypothetical protein